MAELPLQGEVLAAALLLLAAAAAPLLLAGATSFAKIAVVLGLLRHALGTPRVPPDLVLAALAAILTGLVMGPTASKALEAAGPLDQALASPQALALCAERAAAPVRAFLERHADPAEQRFLHETAARLRGNEGSPEKGLVLLAAFALSELKRAFRLGLLLFLPFLVVDLVVSNTLLAAGLVAVPPDRVALPFKLLLFVLMDGWRLLAEGLLAGYG